MGDGVEHAIEDVGFVLGAEGRPEGDMGLERWPPLSAPGQPAPTEEFDQEHDALLGLRS